jgi:hypothetical protein
MNGQASLKNCQDDKYRFVSLILQMSTVRVDECIHHFDEHVHHYYYYY